MHKPSIKEKWFAKRIFGISLDEYKIKIATERLEIVEKSKQAIVEKQEPLEINPAKMWILCPITGKKVKTCFKKHCKEYDFCHTMRKSNIKSIQSEVEEAYSSKIIQLSGKYCEV